MIGEWVALPVWKAAGGGRIGDTLYDEIFHPVAGRLLKLVDAVLRLPGASTGADNDVRRASERGCARLQQWRRLLTVCARLQVVHAAAKRGEAALEGLLRVLVPCMPVADTVHDHHSIVVNQLSERARGSAHGATVKLHMDAAVGRGGVPSHHEATWLQPEPGVLLGRDRAQRVPPL